MDAQVAGNCDRCAFHHSYNMMGLVTHTQTTLFAAVQAQLLIALPQSLGRPVDTVLRFFGYSGLFLNLGATLSAILLLIAVASLPAAACGVYISCSHSYPRKLFHDPHGSHNTDLNRLLLDRDGESQLLRAFGIARGWGILLRHCVVCFLGGWVCAFLHIVINLWLSQSHLVAALIMPSAVFAIIPPLVVFSLHMDSSSCEECDEDGYAIVFDYSACESNPA